MGRVIRRTDLIASVSQSLISPALHLETHTRYSSSRTVNPGQDSISAWRNLGALERCLDLN